MKHKASKKLLGAWLLSAAMLSGCNTTDKPRQSVSGRQISGQTSARDPGKTDTAVVQKSIPPEPGEVPPVIPPSDMVRQAGFTSPYSSDKVTQTAGNQPAELEPVDNPKWKTMPEANERALPRKSAADPDARSCFGNAEDFTWLSGQVEYSRLSKGWRLRYRSLGDDDPYGGCVTLLDHPQLASLKDGMFIRVRGHLVNPDRHVNAAAYRIESFQPLQQDQ